MCEVLLGIRQQATNNMYLCHDLKKGPFTFIKYWWKTVQRMANGNVILKPKIKLLFYGWSVKEFHWVYCLK